MQEKRKNVRLKGYNYAESGWYFVTICSQNRENIFGDIIDNNKINNIVGARRDSPADKTKHTIMKLNFIGLIVNQIWQSLPNHHSIMLDSFQIMPNHIHFIICLTGASRRAPTLGWIIGIFKTECTKQINRLNKSANRKIFQRNYGVYPERSRRNHIIRNDKELNILRQYIKRNPLLWEKDINNIKRSVY